MRIKQTTRYSSRQREAASSFQQRSETLLGLRSFASRHLAALRQPLFTRKGVEEEKKEETDKEEGDSKEEAEVIKKDTKKGKEDDVG